VSGRVVLVTGTDTGVGKTHVACALARALRAAGRSVGVRKPAETGCAPAAGASAGDVPAFGMELFPADAAALAEAAGGGEALARVCPHRFAEPLAPAVAAQRAGVGIDVAGLVAEMRARANEVDVLLVEGAGGLLVPLARDTTFADVAVALGAELVLVVGARLGAINHALLTIEAARSRGLAVAGVVVNHFAAGRDLATDTLQATLADLLRGRVATLASVAHGDDGVRRLAALAVALARRTRS
jgi:dethiobiotin synthetase